MRALARSYKDFYEINLEKRKELHAIFEKNLDPKRILRDLSVDRGSPINLYKRLLFFMRFKHVQRQYWPFAIFMKKCQNFILIGAGLLLVENFIGQEMVFYAAAGMHNNLFYWHRQARGSNAEIDYLSLIKGQIIPIEVKSGKGSTLRSLHSFLASHPGSPYGIKISLSQRSVFAFELVEGGKERVEMLLGMD